MEKIYFVEWIFEQPDIEDQTGRDEIVFRNLDDAVERIKQLIEERDSLPFLTYPIEKTESCVRQGAYMWTYYVKEGMLK